MKLSDIKGERTLEVIAELIDPIANIAEDEQASAMFKREKLPEGMTAREFVAQRAKKSTPILLKNHKEDVISILATLEGVTVGEYTNSLNIAKLMTDILELLTDEDFMSFFTSAPEKAAGESSGSAPENIEVT